jgi:hypothetical protein
MATSLTVHQSLLIFQHKVGPGRSGYTSIIPLWRREVQEEQPEEGHQSTFQQARNSLGIYLRGLGGSGDTL